MENLEKESLVLEVKVIEEEKVILGLGEIVARIVVPTMQNNNLMVLGYIE